MAESRTGLTRELVACYLNQLRRCGLRELPLDRNWRERLREAPSAPPVRPRPLTVREEAPATLSPSAPPAPPVSPAARTFRDAGEKAEALEALRGRAAADAALRSRFPGAQNLVFGIGAPDADILFVGEAPGEDEDREAEPFVGPAGQLLTKMIEAMGLSREQVYIANIVKYRPDMPEGSHGNRKPTPEEMRLCLPLLLEQIEIIQPRVMVALGATAVEGLFDIPRAGITAMRGRWKQFRDIPVMPTFHPAYLLRNKSMAEKRKVWEDLLQVMEKIGLPVSDKQRGYFLKHL